LANFKIFLNLENDFCESGDGEIDEKEKIRVQKNIENFIKNNNLILTVKNFSLPNFVEFEKDEKLADIISKKNLQKIVAKMCENYFPENPEIAAKISEKILSADKKNFPQLLNSLSAFLKNFKKEKNSDENFSIKNLNPIFIFGKMANFAAKKIFKKNPETEILNFLDEKIAKMEN